MDWISLSADNDRSRFPTSKKIKNVRRDMAKSCQQCNKAEDSKCRFHVCAKCKEIPYCSRECQKANWSFHKMTCAPPSGLITDFPKFCQTMMANDFLFFCFEMLFINEFDLVNNPWRPGGKPLKVEIILDFEPCEMSDLHLLFDPDPKAKIDSRPMQGMLQLCMVVSNHSINGAANLLNPDNYPIAKYAKELGFEMDKPHVSVTFRRWVDGQLQGTTSAFSIHESVIDTCREMKDVAVPSPPGSKEDSIILPMSTFACVELINGLIQHDTKNEWLLRTNMLQTDKRTIKAAASASRPSEAAQLVVKNKILRRIHVAETGSYT